MEDNCTQSGAGTRPLHLILAWCFVGIPLVIGVVRTLANALRLFG